VRRNNTLLQWGFYGSVKHDEADKVRQINTFLHGWSDSKVREINTFLQCSGFKVIRYNTFLQLAGLKGETN